MQPSVPGVKQATSYAYNLQAPGGATPTYANAAPASPLVQGSGTQPGYTAGWSDDRTGAYTTQTTTPAAPAYDPAQIAQYDQAIGTYNTSLNRLGSQLGIAQGNINQQYGTNLNEIDSSKNQAQNSYNTSTTQNGQSYRTNKNTIADQASNGLRGLLRTLGAYGAGGSSDALYNAPHAVADVASQQRAGAGQTYSQNAQGLDTNWNNFLAEDGNSRRKLNDWRDNQLHSVEATSDTTKQDLLSKLAALNGQRASAMGGSYVAGAQPFLDQANGLNNTIDNLGRQVSSYDGRTPVYSAPTLDSYSAGQGAHTSIDPSQGGGGSNPYLAMLLGQNRDKTKALF